MAEGLGKERREKNKNVKEKLLPGEEGGIAEMVGQGRDWKDRGTSKLGTIVKRSPGRFSGSRWQDNSCSLVSVDVHSAGRYAHSLSPILFYPFLPPDCSSLSCPRHLVPIRLSFTSDTARLTAHRAHVYRQAESDTFTRKHVHFPRDWNSMLPSKLDPTLPPSGSFLAPRLEDNDKNV